MPDYTTQQVAELLGISPRRVRALAKSRKVGRLTAQVIKRDVLTFTESDVEALRDRKPGKPKGKG